LKSTVAVVIVTLCTGFASPALAQVDLNDRNSKDIIGTCNRPQGDNTACNFPSNIGGYKNLKGVNLQTGEYTYITFCYFTPVNRSATGGLTVGADGVVFKGSVNVGFTVGDRIYIKQECRDDYLSPQSPGSQNPFRGVPDAIYRFGVLPRDQGTSIKFQVDNEK
jgi:hypothetical protein